MSLQQRQFIFQLDLDVAILFVQISYSYINEMKRLKRDLVLTGMVRKDDPNALQLERTCSLLYPFEKLLRNGILFLRKISVCLHHFGDVNIV